jgi:hypothetical protein
VAGVWGLGVLDLRGAEADAWIPVVQWMGASPPLQERLRHCADADAFLALAESSGPPLSRQDLVLLVMTAQHFCLPWAGRGRRSARAYALGHIRLDPDPAAQAG